MVNNMAASDRVVRAVIGAVLLFLVAMEIVWGPLAWLFGIAAAYLLVTAALGMCPVYKMIDIDSHSHDDTDKLSI